MNLSFLVVLNRTVRSCGLDPARLGGELAECFATWIEARLRKAWHLSTWPDTLGLEQRTYWPTWTAAIYASGAKVWYAPGLAYYQANAATVGGDVPGVSTKWDAYTSDRWIDFAQSGQTEIGEPLTAWANDPRRVKAPGPLAFWHDGTTIYLNPDAPAQPWLRFRKKEPRLTSVAWDAALTYAAGEVIYYTDGNSYLVLAATSAGQDPGDTPAKFRVQTIPEVLADYARLGAKADWLSDDGQDDKATVAENFAAGWLNDRLADLTILQGQTSNYAVQG